jgi:peptidoglycan/LPS O-acetylase OafA/YrhL
MTAADTSTAPRFDAGDGLRGYAALLVLLHHVMRSAGYNNGWLADPFGIYGRSGDLVFGTKAAVYIFFALSGYLIARPFAYALVRGTRLPSFGRYAQSRFLRIVPAFWVIWTLTLIVDGTLGASIEDIAAFYGFVQVYHPSDVGSLMVQSWTLDTEMAFYVGLPVAVVLLGGGVRRLAEPSARARALLAATAVVAVAGIAARVHWNHDILRATFPEFMAAFTPGIAMAILEPLWRERLRGSHRAALCARWLAVVSVTAMAVHGFIKPASPVAVELTGILAGGLVVAALLREWSVRTSWRFFTNRPMAWVGERSYSLYLVHLLILRQLVGLFGVFDSVRLDVLLMLAVLTPLALVASAVSYRLIERPAMRLGRRPRRDPEAAPEPVPSRV